MEATSGDAGPQAATGSSSGGDSSQASNGSGTPGGGNSSGATTGSGDSGASPGGSSSNGGSSNGGDGNDAGSSNGGAAANDDPCGDGALASDEECDDGNRDNGDGCTNACRIELGWECNPSAPSVCDPICGDGRVLGAEAEAGGCDDEDASTPGCNANCEVEEGYRCFGEPSTCVLGCGDGEVSEQEECDDGNSDPMDGCFACAEEDGYECDDMAGEPSECTDVDECDTGDHDCDANATCDDTEGSFTCECNTGYTGSGTSCRDVDECEDSPCLSEAECRNFDGSYECECEQGLGGDGESLCVDVSIARWPVPTTQNDANSYRRETVSGDAIVTDGVTGLVWQDQVSSSAFTWQGAVDHCRDLVLAGHRDWRLPMRVELVTLVLYSSSSTTVKINTTAFPGTPREPFWTGSRQVNDSTEAWTVDFTDGAVQPYADTEEGRARCVRGASDPAAPRYMGDGGTVPAVVEDRWTGLFWYNSSGGNQGQAAHATACSNQGSGSRLPTAHELNTLVDESRASPSVDPIFSGVSNGRHWTSSPHSSGFMAVDLGNSQSIGAGSTASIHAVCVRKP